MDDFVSAADLAKRLGVSEWTVRRLARSHKLPHIRIGRLVRYRLSEVLEQLKNKEQTK